MWELGTWAEENNPSEMELPCSPPQCKLPPHNLVYWCTSLERTPGDKKRALYDPFNPWYLYRDCQEQADNCNTWLCSANTSLSTKIFNPFQSGPWTAMKELQYLLSSVLTMGQMHAMFCSPVSAVSSLLAFSPTGPLFLQPPFSDVLLLQPSVGP